MGQKHLIFLQFSALFNVTFLFADEIEKTQTTVRIGQIKVYMILYNARSVVDHFNVSS